MAGRGRGRENTLPAWMTQGDGVRDMHAYLPACADADHELRLQASAAQVLPERSHHQQDFRKRRCAPPPFRLLQRHCCATRTQARVEQSQAIARRSAAALLHRGRVLRLAVCRALLALARYPSTSALITALCMK